MGDAELDGVFEETAQRTLLVFTSRVRRRDAWARAGRPGQAVCHGDHSQAPETVEVSATVRRRPGVFATNLPDALQSELVRPLTRHNYHSAIEASCLVPLAMGPPLPPAQLSSGDEYADDAEAVFIDGGFALKMPMATFEDDARFRDLACWAATPRAVIFCCDPNGRLWETSMRLRALNGLSRRGQSHRGRPAPDHPPRSPGRSRLPLF